MNQKRNFLDLFKIKSKKVFICGGLGLIGQNITKALHDAGADVLILDINKKLASKFISDNFNEDIDYHYFDCSDLDSIEENLTFLFEKNGCPDIFINCSWPRTKDFANNNFEDISLDSLRKNIDIHLNSYSWLAISIAERMAKTSVKGSIIQYGSSYGLVGQDLSIYQGTEMKENASYAASKGGIINLTRSMASYYGKFGIRVNTICPGGVKGHVAGKNKQPKIFVQNYITKNPIKRFCLPKDISPLCVFLSSSGSDYITGQNFMVDGGWSII